MKIDTGFTTTAPPPKSPLRQRILSRPSTRPGRWAVWLGIIFVILFLINSFVFMPSSSDAPWRHVILPFYGIAMLACGLAAGMTGLIAVIRKHERSWLVWLTFLPGLLVLFLVLGEFLVPH
jgi:predicted Abi (CAAX) family protease